MDELIRYAPALAAGFLKNLQLAAICAVFSLILGTILVIMRVAPSAGAAGDRQRVRQRPPKHATDAGARILGSRPE